MKIVLLGSGNVATHLGKALQKAGEDILQVWSRSMANAAALAQDLHSTPIDHISDVTQDADIYIVSVNDDAISPVVNQLAVGNKLVVHTSGSTNMAVLQDVSAKRGVLYPLQTFSKARPTDFKQIPILIEGSSDEVVQILKGVADKLSEKIFVVSSRQRQTLHIAAVFACNFTNHLYALAADILKQSNLDFELIRPLIAETAEKVQKSYPKAVQTGPAVRNDVKTMDKHMEALTGAPDLQEIYRKLSQSIVNLNMSDKG